MRFNPPPTWPPPPQGWQPAEGWHPDPSWPPVPASWPLWIEDDPHRGGDPLDTQANDARELAAPAIPDSRQLLSRRTVIILATVLVLIAAFVIYRVTGDRDHPANNNAQRLGFSALNSAFRLAADSRGAVYVIESQINTSQVLKLDTNTGTQHELLHSSKGEGRFSDLASDGGGNLYVVQRDVYEGSEDDTAVGRLWHIDTETSEVTSMELSQSNPIGVALGPQGDFYIEYGTNNGTGPRAQVCHIYRMPEFEATESKLTDVNGCYAAYGGDGGNFAVDPSGNLYIVVQKDQEEPDYQWYPLKIAPDGQQTPLPMKATTIAVGATGAIYGSALASGQGAVRVLDPGSNEPRTIEGISVGIYGIAVDREGGVYVTDSDNVYRVLSP
ncbi:hypothetical protein [Mycolicibacterium peregrinum]|uniref:Vgb family protein n=1 Tax=Mycolicibacterium peregrinum TaxID=43304 RepID=UPI001054683B|nr:hypothetical protein [Mycolicibacterium peregrinum]